VNVVLEECPVRNNIKDGRIPRAEERASWKDVKERRKEEGREGGREGGEEKTLNPSQSTNLVEHAAVSTMRKLAVRKEAKEPKAVLHSHKNDVMFYEREVGSRRAVRVACLVISTMKPHHDW
jgi:hypothetical protein